MADLWSNAAVLEKNMGPASKVLNPSQRLLGALDHFEDVVVFRHNYLRPCLSWLVHDNDVSKTCQHCPPDNHLRRP